MLLLALFMFSLNKSLTIVSFLVLSGAVMCCTEKPVQSVSQETQTTPTQKPGTNQALGVPIPNLVYADDVKKYMREILSAPLPVGYVLPDDVRLTGDYGLSVAKVNEHYPQFLNLESEDLLRAVKANPVAYQEMMLEARSVRELYFPGSQPKATN